MLVLRIQKNPPKYCVNSNQINVTSPLVTLCPISHAYSNPFSNHPTALCILAAARSCCAGHIHTSTTKPPTITPPIQIISVEQIIALTVSHFVHTYMWMCCYICWCVHAIYVYIHTMQTFSAAIYTRLAEREKNAECKNWILFIAILIWFVQRFSECVQRPEWFRLK